MSNTTCTSGGTTSSGEEDETTLGSYSSSDSTLVVSSANLCPETLTAPMKKLIAELETCTQVIQSHQRTFGEGRRPGVQKLPQNIGTHRTGVSGAEELVSSADTSSNLSQLTTRSRQRRGTASSSSYTNSDTCSLITEQPDSTVGEGQITSKSATYRRTKNTYSKDAADYKKKLDALHLRESQSRSKFVQANISATPTPLDNMRKFFRELGQYPVKLPVAKGLTTSSPKQILPTPRNVAITTPQESKPKNHEHRLSAGRLTKNYVATSLAIGNTQPSNSAAYPRALPQPCPSKPVGITASARNESSTSKGVMAANESLMRSLYKMTVSKPAKQTPSRLSGGAELLVPSKDVMTNSKPEKQTTSRMGGGAELLVPSKLSPRVLDMPQPVRNFPERLRSRLALSGTTPQIFGPKTSRIIAMKNEEAQKPEQEVQPDLLVPFGMQKNVYLPKAVRNYLHEEQFDWADSTSALINARTQSERLMKQHAGSIAEVFGPVVPRKAAKSTPEYQLIHQQFGYTEDVKPKNDTVFPIECVLQVHVPLEVENDGIRIDIIAKKLEVSSSKYNLRLPLLMTADTSKCSIKYLFKQKMVEIILRLYRDEE